MKIVIKSMLSFAFRATALLCSGIFALSIFSAYPVMAGDAHKPLPAGSVIKATATTGMIADIVREVGGKQVRLKTLMKPGVDPHLYKLTRVDLRVMLNSDVVFYNGLILEGKMIDSLDRIRRNGKAVVAVAESLSNDTLRGLEGYEDQIDPHVWMDVGRWVKTVGVVTDTLTQLLPEHGAVFAERAGRYRDKLTELDNNIRSTIHSIPVASRILVTAHDAFGYFGEAYNIEVIGIQGVSTESEAGLKRIEDLVNMLVERKIPTVFVESSVSERNVKALIAGAAARKHVITIGGVLYSDATGKAGTWEGTYPGMLEHNANVISTALGGKPLVGTVRTYSDKQKEITGSALLIAPVTTG